MTTGNNERKGGGWVLYLTSLNLGARPVSRGDVVGGFLQDRNGDWWSPNPINHPVASVHGIQHWKTHFCGQRLALKKKIVMPKCI